MVSRVFLIARRTFLRLLQRPTTWVSLGLFALVAGALFWMEFVSPWGAELSMRAYYERAPLLLAVFAPAWAMDTLTADRRHDTLRVWRSLGVEPVALVAGTWLGLTAVWFLLLLLISQVPWWLTRLGPVDGGAVLVGWIGLGLLGATFLAIGVATASWTRDPVVALLTGVTVCGALVAAGDAGDVLGIEGLSVIGLEARFRTFARGVLDLRDVNWFLAITLVALGVATRNVQRGVSS